MSWIELSLDATGEGVDWVYSLLAKTGFEPEIRIDQYSSRNLTNLTSPTHTWEFHICLYLLSDIQVTSQIRKIENSLHSLQRTGLVTQISEKLVEQIPATGNVWRSVQEIGEKFAIAKSHNPGLGDRMIIKTRPSLAFGSGFHPATILALQLMERHIQEGMNGLDLGCGSGILSVALAKLGTQVLAVDNDAIATQATREMVVDNNVETQVTVKQGSLGSGSDLGHWLGGDIHGGEDLTVIPATANFDFIVANILGRIHIQLASEYQQALRPSSSGGILITAGFNQDMEREVESALSQHGLRLIDSIYLDEWVGFVHQCGF